MSYLMQVWRGVPHPKFGGHGWVTYGGAVSEARAFELLALSQRLRPELRHKLRQLPMPFEVFMWSWDEISGRKV